MRLRNPNRLHQGLTHALYDLAAYPAFMQPLRDEVESVITANGWTKLAMHKLWKLDSFLRESQRMNGTSLSTSCRTLSMP